MENQQDKTGETIVLIGLIIVAILLIIGLS